MINEALAVVEGRVLAELAAAGYPIPPWAWLNALAYQPAGHLCELVDVACDQPGAGWPDAIIEIVASVSQLDEPHITELQAAIFLPALVDALVGRGVADGPSQLVHTVRRYLAVHVHPSDAGRGLCRQSDISPGEPRSVNRMHRERRDS